MKRISPLLRLSERAEISERERRARSDAPHLYRQVNPGRRVWKSASLLRRLRDVGMCRFVRTTEGRRTQCQWNDQSARAQTGAPVAERAPRRLTAAGFRRLSSDRRCPRNGNGAHGVPRPTFTAKLTWVGRVLGNPPHYFGGYGMSRCAALCRILKSPRSKRLHYFLKNSLNFLLTQVG
jgi:hypothetical protein